MEEDNVYYRTNEELEELIDSFDGPSLPSVGGLPQEMDIDCERRKLLKERGNMAWIETLAGALSMESIEKVYDREDLDLNVRECMERKKRRLAKHARESASQKTLEEKRVVIQAEKKIIESEAVKYGVLVQLGERLVGDDTRGFILLLQTERDHEILRGENLTDMGVEMRLRDQVVIFQSIHPREGGDDARDEFFRERGREVLWRSIFTPVTLFNLYLNNDSAGANRSVRHIMEANSKSLESTNYVFLLRSQLMNTPQAPSVAPLAIPVVSSSLPIVEGIDWALLEGSETVFLPLVGAYYNKEGLKDMVKFGCLRAYGQHPTSDGTSYTDMVMRYLFGATEREREAVLHNLNIFFHAVDGQPESVLRVLHRVIKTYDAGITRLLMMAHFLWCYFSRCSSLRLAYDWFTYGKKLELGRFGLLAIAKAQLAEYFSLVILLLLRPGGLHTVVDGKPLFRIPLGFAGYDFSVPTAVNDDKRLDIMNGLFLADNVCVSDLIVNDTFRRFINTLESVREPVEECTRLHYPILCLHTTLDGYFQFMQQRLLTLDVPEEPINIAEEEEEGEDEVGEAIRLRPIVGYYVGVAYDKVQIYCPWLKGLPQEEFQAKHAFESGLLTAYTTFVAALESEGKLFSTPNRPKSLHQRRHTLQHTRDALIALKHYRYRKLPGGRYRTERERMRSGGLFRF